MGIDESKNVSDKQTTSIWNVFTCVSVKGALSKLTSSERVSSESVFYFYIVWPS